MNRYLVPALAAGLLACLDANPAGAASFDCLKASTNVEKMICGNPALSRLDDQMAEAYRQRVAATGNSPAVGAAQIAWRQERDRCSDEACLTAVYSRRIQELSQPAQGGAVRGQVQHSDVDLLKLYETFNTRCRGGAGSERDTKWACDSRDAVADDLEKRGWCWGKPTDQAEYQRTWTLCRPPAGTGTSACMTAVEPYIRAYAIAFAAHLCSLRSAQYLDVFARAIFTARQVNRCSGSQEESTQSKQIYDRELAANNLDPHNLESMCKWMRRQPGLLNDLDAKYGQITLNYR